MREQLKAETTARGSVKTPPLIAETPKRDMLFLSHANPEDNAFTRWLALRLAREGYPIWCDLTKLLGGEDFWRDIEMALRQRAMKVLFVLSKASNRKAGTLKEIAVAEKVGKAFKDFIIPLRIDDLSSNDIEPHQKRCFAPHSTPLPRNRNRPNHARASRSHWCPAKKRGDEEQKLFSVFSLRVLRPFAGHPASE